jgi:hypothetical protein
MTFCLIFHAYNGFCLPNLQDYNHQLAQTRAGRSSKSKLLLAKFSQANAVEGWELREGLYFSDEIAGKYDGGMDAQFEVTEDGNGTFSGMQLMRRM